MSVSVQREPDSLRRPKKLWRPQWERLGKFCRSGSTNQLWKLVKLPVLICLSQPLCCWASWLPSPLPYLLSLSIFKDPLTFVPLNFCPHSLVGWVCHCAPLTFNHMYQTRFFHLISVIHKAVLQNTENVIRVSAQGLVSHMQNTLMI